MSVILRVDDFPGTKTEEFWKHNLDNFKRFDAVLEKYKVPEYVLGVIPKYTTEAMIKYLSENERITVALHGVEHDERFPNEFRDHETEDGIVEKLKSARYPLIHCNGIPGIQDYIPPHNVLDFKTVHALSRLNFKRVFGGPGTTVAACDRVEQCGMQMIYSSHPNSYGRTDELLDRDNAEFNLNEAHRLSEQKTVCLTLHWTWEYNIGLESLDRFMGKLGHVFR